MGGGNGVGWLVQGCCCLKSGGGGLVGMLEVVVVLLLLLLLLHPACPLRERDESVNDPMDSRFTFRTVTIRTPEHQSHVTLRREWVGWWMMMEVGVAVTLTVNSLSGAGSHTCTG